MKIVARVKRVLKGDSPIALVHGVTEDGHEVKLEVERHQTEGIERNAILVIDWYSYDLPALPDPPSKNTEPTGAPKPTPTKPETPPSAAAEPVEPPKQPAPEQPPPAQPEPAEPTSTAPDPAASTESAPTPAPPAERNVTLPSAGTTPDPRRRRNAQPDASAGATVDARLRHMLKIPR